MSGDPRALAAALGKERRALEQRLGAARRRLEKMGEEAAVAEACTARDSESKKRLAGSRFCEPVVRVCGCVTSSWRARTTSACSASSSSAEMNEADWKTVATGEQMLPAASGSCRKKTSDEKSCL